MNERYFDGPSDEAEEAPQVTAQGAFAPWWALAPVLCPTAVVAIFVVFQRSFQLAGFDMLPLDVPGFERGPTAVAAIHAALTYWGGALFIATLVSMILVAGAAALVARAMLPAWLKGATVAVALAIFAIICLWPAFAMSRWVLGELQLIEDTTKFSGLLQLKLFLAFLFATAFLLAAGVAMALHGVVSARTDIRGLVRVQGEVRALLGLTTFWLIIGVLGMGMLHRLTAACALPELRSAVEEIGASATILAGSFYSALLAATFGSAELLLRRAGAQLANGHADGSVTAQQWLEARGFELSVSQSLARVVAVFSPLLASVAQNIASFAG